MKSTKHWAFPGVIPCALLIAALTDCGGRSTDAEAGSAEMGGSHAQGGGASTVGTSPKGGTTWTIGSNPKGGATWTIGSNPKGGATWTIGSNPKGGATSTTGSSPKGGATSTTGSSPKGGSSATGGTHSGGGSHPGAGTAGFFFRVPAVHRAAALSCVGVHSPAEPPTTIPTTTPCVKHADCTEGVNGKCITTGMGRGAGYYYYCVYDQCATDADCDAGTICYCTASSAARCLAIGNCNSDADCGNSSFSYCSPSMGFDCQGYHSVDAYHCHTASDSCVDDTDCTGTDYCDFNIYEGRWMCTAKNDQCAIG